MNAETLREWAIRLDQTAKDAPAKTVADVPDKALEIMNEFMRQPSEVPAFPFDHFWQRKVAVLCERIADTERRLANTGSHIEAYAKALDGLELHKLVIGGDTFDGARDARAIRRVVEHLLNWRGLLEEIDEALTELGWHTDRGILQRVRQALRK